MLESVPIRKRNRTFCPAKQCYDPNLNHDCRYGRPLPSFSWLIERGKVCALNFPVSLNPGLARALGAFLKMDFQRAVLNRIPLMATHPEEHYRQVFFICDEYHLFAVPVVVGGGTRWLPDHAHFKLELLDERRFDSGVVHVHYRRV